MGFNTHGPLTTDWTKQLCHFIKTLKYEDIPCGSTTDLRESVLDCVENGTKNLYVIVNYSGLYRTNHMLTELEKTCGKTGEGKAGQEKSAAGKPEPGAQDRNREQKGGDRA